MDQEIELEFELGARNKFGFQTTVRVTGSSFTDKLMQERVDANAAEINEFLRLHPELGRGQWNG